MMVETNLSHLICSSGSVCNSGIHGNAPSQFLQGHLTRGESMSQSVTNALLSSPGKIYLLLSEVDGILVTKEKILTARARAALANSRKQAFVSPSLVSPPLK
jgi:hypothetical protein